MSIREIHGNPTLLVTLVMAFVLNHRLPDKKWIEVQGEFYCTLCVKHLKLDLTDQGVCGLGTVLKVGALAHAKLKGVSGWRTCRCSFVPKTAPAWHLHTFA